MTTAVNEREWFSAHRGLQAPLPTGFESQPLALVARTARKKGIHSNADEDGQGVEG